MIDPFEFAELNDKERNVLNNLIETAEEDISPIELSQIFNAIFTTIDPSIPLSVILSSTKDYNRLNFPETSVKRGIHELRSYCSHLIVSKRRKTFETYLPALKHIPNHHIKQFWNNGITVINDFLTKEETETIRSNLENPFPINVPKNPHNLLINFKIYDIFLNAGLYEIIVNCLAKRRDQTFETKEQFERNTYIQKLTNSPNDGDIQKVMHMDTFFSTLKFWYFPNEVKENESPFGYAPGSNVLSQKRIKWIHEQSVKITRRDPVQYQIIEKERTRSHTEGSLRVMKDELEEMEFEEKKFPCPANTLMLADTFGFHRRTESTNDSTRNSIHGSIRTNFPFSF